MNDKFDLSHMPYIRNKNMFKAVMFVRYLIRKSVPIKLAIYKSAKYYDLSITEVARYVGKLGSNTRDGHIGNDTCFDNDK